MKDTIIDKSQYKPNELEEMERYLKSHTEEEKELYFKNLILEKEKLSQSSP